MKPNSIDTAWKILRESRSKHPLLSENEIRHLTNNPPVAETPVIRISDLSSHSLRLRYFYAAAVVAAIAFFFWNGLLVEKDTPKAVQRHRQEAADTDRRGVESLPPDEFRSVGSARLAKIEKPSKNSPHTVVVEVQPLQEASGRVVVFAMGALQLRSDELQKLGVEVLKGFVSVNVEEEFSSNQNNIRSFLTNLGYAVDSTETTLLRSAIRIDTAGFLNLAARELQNGETSVTVTPKAMTVRFYENNVESHSFSTVFSRRRHLEGVVDRSFALIPVEMHIEGTNFTSSVQLWYEPTQEFLDALPIGAGLQLKYELSTLNDVRCNALSSSAACGAMRGAKTVVNICNSDDGAITQFFVSPNPVHERAIAKYELLKARKIRIALYSFDGVEIKTMFEGEHNSAGIFEAPLLFDNIPGGSYVLALTSNHGEKTLQRIIIQ